jgi:hypothetical protein
MWAEHTALKFVTTASITRFASFKEEPIPAQSGWFDLEYAVSGHYRSHASVNLRYTLDSDDEESWLYPAVLISLDHFPNCRHCLRQVLRSAEFTDAVQDMTSAIVEKRAEGWTYRRVPPYKASEYHLIGPFAQAVRPFIAVNALGLKQEAIQAVTRLAATVPFRCGSALHAQPWIV